MERAQVAVQGAGGGVPMLCDLADLSSVRNFAAELQEKAPKLDVLCLNAGMSPSTKATVAGRTKDGFEECVVTNHLGHFLLANLLQPHRAIVLAPLGRVAQHLVRRLQPHGADHAQSEATRKRSTYCET